MRNPLGWSGWNEALDQLIQQLAAGDDMSDIDAIRQLVDILARAPHPDLLDGMQHLDPMTLEKLLGINATETVALRLLGDESGFFASRGPEGDYLVSVLLMGSGPEVTATGPTLARATICALALALAAPDHPARGGPRRGISPAVTLH